MSQNTNGPAGTGPNAEHGSSTHSATTDIGDMRFHWGDPGPGRRDVLTPASQIPMQARPAVPYRRAVVYRNHGPKCSVEQHRTWKALGECLWPYAAWVHGWGQWASVSRCKSGTVWLHPTEAAARASLDFIDDTACGGRCSRHHYLIKIDDELVRGLQ